MSLFNNMLVRLASPRNLQEKDNEDESKRLSLSNLGWGLSIPKPTMPKPTSHQLRFEWQDDVVDPVELERLLFLVNGNWIVYRSSTRPPRSESSFIIHASFQPIYM